MKVFKYGAFSIILNHVESVSKSYSKAEPYVGIPEYFILYFEMTSGKKHDFYYTSKIERDTDYNKIISMIEEI